MSHVLRMEYGTGVFDESVSRIQNLYEEGHRIVVSFSAGKDSGVCLELCLLAAENARRLPVEVVMRDEEILFPGSFEYAERMYRRKNVDFHWLIANHPIINCFDRECPYWWVFDPLLKPEQWVRKPPSFAEHIKELNIEHMADTKRFPVEQNKHLIHIIGLRVQESQRRKWAVHSAKGFITKPHGQERNANPIYDWKDEDVWKAIRDNHWDYNEAYDVMYRVGVPKKRLRIAPPTMNAYGVPVLRFARVAWPQWFERVCHRLPGVRAVTRYGLKVVKPIKFLSETWQQCFERTCIRDAPEWIRKRAVTISKSVLREHARHSTTPFPNVGKCTICSSPASWRDLANQLYMGNPFLSTGHLDRLGVGPVEPEEFRSGAGKWGGKATW